AFQQCARWGLEARVRWPKVGRVRVADLLLEHLIPQAMDGLRSLGAEADVAAHYGGILSERARTGRNGARWQIDTVTSLEVPGATAPRWTPASRSTPGRSRRGSGTEPPRSLARSRGSPVPARQRD